MQSLTQQLTTLVGNIFTAADYDPKYGEVVVSNRPDLGQFQCNGALPAAKVYGRNPREIAQQIVDELGKEPIFKEISLAGPGFINLTLTDAYLVEFVQQMADDERLGAVPVVEPRKVKLGGGLCLESGITFLGPRRAEPE